MQRVEMNAINIQIISFKENNFIIGTSIYVHKGDLSSYIYIYIYVQLLLKLACRTGNFNVAWVKFNLFS